ncbi:MAG: serine/threonine protein kinase, partial [Deltaproteobacteria bacterium]|nr:serine/threonine protein kinase [Kofleriaceae bacterium]
MDRSLADAASPDDLVAPEGGRYVHLGELGRGGLGKVALVRDRRLGREIAIKQLVHRSRASRARFRREAQLTAQLEHPAIVPVHELGVRPDGTLYYTMKRIRGRSLGSALRDAKTLQDRLRLISHFRRLCEAVAYAHSRGVVHRDLKPENVMVGEFGETLVVDWGLAKVRGSDDPQAQDLRERVHVLAAGKGSGSDATSTIHGHAIGTPAYMSPEQARGDLEAIDERSDVWGLGAILFEILTGRPPFVGGRAMEVLEQVREKPAPRVRDVSREAPAELAAIADRALVRDRSSRYPGAKELADEIAAWQDGGDVRAYEYSTWDLVRRFVGRHRVASLVLAGALAAGMAATIVTYRGYLAEGRARAIAESRR